MSAKTTQDNWTCEPFGKTIPLPYDDVMTEAEWATASMGLLPEAMEDKWFVYEKDDTLHLHRSWTGLPVYRIRYALSDDGTRTGSAEVSADLTDNEAPLDLQHDAKLARWLVRVLLLRENLPFPRSGESPEGDDVPGLEQHVIAGTGYPEAPPDSEG